MQLLRAAGHKRMPWKNGKGETAEIAVFPEGAPLGEFGWRLSMATVVEPGPFSAFPEIDRVLAIVSGGGLQLDIGGRDIIVSREGKALAFPGDVTVASFPFGTPVIDLNLMTRRGQFQGSITRVRGETATVITPKALTFVVALADCTLTTDVQSVALKYQDAVRLEVRDRPVTLQATGGLELLVVSISAEA